MLLSTRISGAPSLFHEDQDIFKAKSQIDVPTDGRAWKTRGTRAGSVAWMSASVGVMSRFGSQAFFLLRGDHGGEPVAFSTGLSLIHWRSLCG